MSETIYDLLKHRQNHWQRCDGSYGFEIETETNSPYPVPQLNWWKNEPDGSLRGFGIEYVTKIPVDGDSLPEVLQEFSDIDVTFNPPSISNSVHVHRNVLNTQPLVLANVLATYVMVEPVLCKFAGPLRESNLFCLQLRDAHMGMDYIIDVLKYVGTCAQIGGDNMHRSHAMKYAALNMGAFWDYGSIEFRALRGTTDTTIIRQWIEMIDMLFEFGETMRDPEDVLSAFQFDLDDILDRIFKHHAPILEYQDWQKDVQSNAWFGWRISYLFEKWEEFGFKFLPRIKKSDVQETAERRAAIRQTTVEAEWDVSLIMEANSKGVYEAPIEGENFEWEEDPPAPTLQWVPSSLDFDEVG